MHSGRNALEALHMDNLQPAPRQELGSRFFLEPLAFIVPSHLQRCPAAFSRMNYPENDALVNES